MEKQVGENPASPEIVAAGLVASNGSSLAVPARPDSSDAIWDAGGELTAAGADSLGSPVVLADFAERGGRGRSTSRRLRFVRHGRRLLLAGVALAAVGLLGRLLQHGADGTAVPSAPTGTTVVVTAPAIAVTTATAPAVTAPAITGSTATAPAVTAPAITGSGATAPAVTAPAVAGSGEPVVTTTVRTLATPSVGPIDPPLARYLAPTRWALAVKGKLYLRGRVPDKATADKLATRAAAVARDGNVVVDLTIDPTVSASGSTPLLFDDAVHFAEGNDVVRVEEQSLPELARFLLERNDTATVRLFANADSSTDADLMLRRSTACSDFIRRFGIELRRVSITTRGEAGGSSGAARPGPSVELAIDGLFDG